MAKSFNFDLLFLCFSVQVCTRAFDCFVQRTSEGILFRVAHS